MYKVYQVILLTLLTQISFGQQHQAVFPSLSDQQLFDSLVANYKPDSVLVWGDAKDTIFAVIDNVNDTVTCVYTGLRKWLDPSQDPSDFMAMNNDPNGMNIEHTYPQSKGAANGNARADMHHLFPARNETNNMRGNLPFDELNDSLVTNWFYLTFNAQGIPVFNIDDYSELLLNVAFEPKENWKGNVARAMFYFYTMYRNEANAVDNAYFNLQKEVLCDWHMLDPVDQVEWDRSYQIAAYQDNKPNPFVLDCSLAKRLYCPNQAANCMGTDVTQQKLPGFKVEAPSPNPASVSCQLTYELETAADIQIELYDLLGQRVAEIFQGTQSSGYYQLNLKPSKPLSSGLYLIRYQFKAQGQVQQYTQKLIWAN